MFCSECGKQVEDNAKFCGECGAVQSNVEQTPEIKVEQAANRNKLQAPLTVTPSSGKSSRVGIFLLWIVIVVAALFALKHFQNQTETAQEGQSNQVESVSTQTTEEKARLAKEAESMRAASVEREKTVGRTEQEQLRSEAGAANNNSQKEYLQLFVCASEDNFLPVANNLAQTLLGYIKAGETVAYQQIINNSDQYFRGSMMGQCKQHGFLVKILPNGEKVLYGENDKAIFWLIKTRGLSGGAYIGIAEYK